MGNILLAGFILLGEWSTVMMVVSLFIIHHVVCRVCVCVHVCVSETGPGPLPAHYSLAVLCVCARASGLSVQALLIVSP